MADEWRRVRVVPVWKKWPMTETRQVVRDIVIKNRKENSE